MLASPIRSHFVRVLASAATASLLAGCTTPVDFSSGGLVISDVTIVSPERAAPLQHGFVRILDGKIVAVSDRPLRGEQHINGSGRFLIPGLIDSHVHLALPPGFPAAMTAAQAAAHPDVVNATLAQDPKSYLFYGFTSVIDLVGTSERTAQWNALTLRPDAFFCGAALIVGGRTQRIGYPYFSYGKTLLERILPTPGNTPEAVVGSIANEGAVCVKTIHETGLAPTIEEGRALVAAAHARQLPVLIHANRKRSQAFAVAVGVDAIVHGMWRDANEPVELDEEARRVLADIARLRIGYQPTTQVIAGLFDMLQQDYLARPEVLDVYPRSFIELCARKEDGCTTSDGIRNPSETLQVRLRGTLDRAETVTRILSQDDAHLLFGSDTPSDLIYANPPGLNGRLEMDHWIAAGVSMEKLFRAMTIENARMFRLDDQIGTIEPGKTANLLLLGANPLESVKAYDAIELVLLHGRPIPRTELSARSSASSGRVAR